MSQGWNRSKFSLVIGPPHVDVASSLMWDWSHTFVSSGLADTEMGMLFKVFQKTPGSGSYVEFREYLETWRLPRSRESLLNLFSDEQIRLNLKDTKFSCGASDMLNLSPILLKYLRDVVLPRGLCSDHVECMVAVLEALELLQATKGGLVDAQQLEDRPQIKCACTLAGIFVLRECSHSREHNRAPEHADTIHARQPATHAACMRPPSCTSAGPHKPPCRGRGAPLRLACKHDPTISGSTSACPHAGCNHDAQGALLHNIWCREG